MTTKDILGKVITDIYVSIDMEVGGLDTGECFIKLDNNTFINFPFGDDSELLEIKPPSDATSIFQDLSDIPVYQVNKEGKTIEEVAENFKRKQNSLIYKFRKLFVGDKGSTLTEYKPYKVEFRENKLKHLKDKKIIDFIWFSDDTEKGLLLLENGYLMTETLVAPHGTGLAGLNVFENLEELASRRSDDYLKLTEIERGSR